jgi:hypothetical protein
MGGQYISVIPSLEMVAVIRSGNYRTGRDATTRRDPAPVHSSGCAPITGGSPSK